MTCRLWQGSALALKAHKSPKEAGQYRLIMLQLEGKGNTQYRKTLTVQRVHAYKCLCAQELVLEHAKHEGKFTLCWLLMLHA